MELPVLEIILHNYNAILALIFGFTAWYAATEAWMNRQVKARDPAILFFICLGALNVINGLSRIANVHIAAELSLLFFLPMVIFLTHVALLFRRERKNEPQSHHRIDISLKVGALRIRPQDLKIVWASQGIENIVSYRASELIGHTLRDFSAEESKKTVDEFQTELTHGNVPYDLELAIKGKQREIIWVQVANTREYNATGEFTTIIAGIKDITERKTLQAEAELLKEAIHSLPVGITISDLSPDRKILYINHTEATMHGYRFQKLLGRSVRMMTPKALWPLFGEVFTFDLLDGLDRETLNVRKNGDFFPVRLQTAIVYDSSHIPQAIVSMSEPLIESLGRQKTLYPGLNCLPMDFQEFIAGRTNQETMMIFFDRKRSPVVCNNAAILSLGYTLKEMQEDMDRVYATPADLARVKDYIFTPRREIVTLQIRTKSGDIKTQCWIGFHAIFGTLALGYECSEESENGETHD